MDSNKRSRTCEAWKYFTKIEPGDVENPRAKCNFCGTSYACHPVRNGTTTLNKHVSNCKLLLASLDENQKSLLLRKKEPVGDSSLGSLTVKSFNQERCREKLARMVIIDELPFRVVEGIGFLDFMKEVQPKFVVPCRKTVANDIFKIFMKEKSSLKEFFWQLTSRVCLTTDTWTSVQNINYMVVTAHFVDATWTLHKKIINFVVIPDHRGETIAMILGECLLDWGIERVLTVTVDNASSNDVALTHLVNTIKNWNGLVLNGEFMHMRCFAHIINLIVSNGLKEHNISIMKIRKAVKYVRSSPSRMQKFQTCTDMAKVTCKSKVCLDVSTRWNLTYLMLETAEKFERAFAKLSEYDIQYTFEFVEDKELDGPLTEQDWSVVRDFLVLLKVFYEATLKVSASINITANVFFSEVCKLHRVIKKYVTCDNLSIQKMAIDMQAKYEKYWGDFSKLNHLMYVAVVLDPRYKLKFVKHCLVKLHGEQKANDIIMEFEHNLKRLFLEYSTEAPTRNMEETSTSRPHVENTQDLMDDEEFELSFQAELANEDKQEKKHELENYLDEKFESFSNDNDILSWWRMNTSKYPTLSKIARDVLAIPISTVASESALSCGGRVLNDFRSSLAPKTVEGLICTQSWIRTPSKPVNIYEALDEVDKLEQDLTTIMAQALKE